MLEFLAMYRRFLKNHIVFCSLVLLHPCNPAILPAGLLKSSGEYGWLGVQMFFVILGFVISCALCKAKI